MQVLFDARRSVRQDCLIPCAIYRSAKAGKRRIESIGPDHRFPAKSTASMLCPEVRMIFTGSEIDDRFEKSAFAKTANGNEPVTDKDLFRQFHAVAVFSKVTMPVPARHAKR